MSTSGKTGPDELIYKVSIRSADIEKFGVDRESADVFKSQEKFINQHLIVNGYYLLHFLRATGSKLFE